MWPCWRRGGQGCVSEGVYSGFRIKVESRSLWDEICKNFEMQMLQVAAYPGESTAALRSRRLGFFGDPSFADDARWQPSRARRSVADLLRHSLGRTPAGLAHPRGLRATAGSTNVRALQNGASRGEKFGRFKFNLDEYMVTLEKPIGIRFAQSEEGKVYVEALAKKGNADNSRMIMVGDVLKKTSSVFGDALWEVDDFGRIMHAIKMRSGAVSLVFERTAQAVHARAPVHVPPRPANTHRAMPGAIGVATWRPSTGSMWAGKVGFVGFSVLRLRTRSQAVSSSGLRDMVEDEDVDIGYKGSKARAEYEAKSGADCEEGEECEEPAQPATRVAPQPALAASRGEVPGRERRKRRESGRDRVVVTAEETVVQKDTGRWGSSDPVEEYNEEVKRAWLDLNYHHTAGMSFTKITRDIYLGSCLQSPTDVHTLAHTLHTTAVLNLQMKTDQASWRIDTDAIERAAHSDGILILDHPIRDFDAADLRVKLPRTAAVLHRLLRSGHRVFVTCTAGLGRSPTAVIAYLHWFNKMTLVEAFAAVTLLRPSAPNRLAIVGATYDMVTLAQGGRHKGPATHAVQLAWNHGGKEVLLVGEFLDGWKEPVPLTPVGGRKFVTELRIPQGKYHYKFIVDKQWRYAPELPTERDKWGNTNNVIHIGRPPPTWTETAIHHPSKLGLPAVQDTVRQRVLERPLTETERRLLSYAANRLALSISPVTFMPKRPHGVDCDEAL